jgi:lysophospholipase L1-like esterase
MRLQKVIVVVATIGMVFGSLAGATSTAQPATFRTYLALGDSLAASFQPNGDTHSGYVEQVLQLEQSRLPDLRLVKLGCPGETTRTMDVPKKRCPYEEGTQLDQALAVLEQRDVAFVTLQIGSNDLIQCFRFGQSAFNEACVDQRLPAISARLTSIVESLRGAAGPDVPIMGSTYYDPFLFLWTVPGLDHDLAVAAAGVWGTFNDMLEETYAALGVPVADIEAEFSSADFDTIVHARGVGDVPINVARICQWTYTCSEAFDHDLHPNTIGYASLTRAWEAALATAVGEPSS